MRSRNLALLLLVSIMGCRDKPNAGSTRDGPTLSRERIVEIADGRIRKIGLYQEGRTKTYFDDGNKRWHAILEDLERNEPEAAKIYHKKLAHRDYQAVHFGQDPPSLGGTCWIFVDKRTGQVIMCAVGL